LEDSINYTKLFPIAKHEKIIFNLGLIILRTTFKKMMQDIFYDTKADSLILLLNNGGPEAANV